jgi:catechol 2,3-dioxygenase-like lactoylglutathione lyase family enzyme
LHPFLYARERSAMLHDFEVIGLDHVQLAAPAGCEDAARAFYGELLGLTELEKPATLAGRGGKRLLHADMQSLRAELKPNAAARKAHPALLVRNLDALAQRLQAAGAAVTWDNDLPGYRRFYASDPWGNRLELLWPDKS